MRGYRIHYKPGWDCHGLPIEMKAVSSKAKLTPLQIRDKGKNNPIEMKAVSSKAKLTPLQIRDKGKNNPKE